MHYLQQGKLPHFPLFMHIIHDIGSKLNVTALIYKVSNEDNPI